MYREKEEGGKIICLHHFYLGLENYQQFSEQKLALFGTLTSLKCLEVYLTNKFYKC